MLTAMFSNAVQYNLDQRSLAHLLTLIMLTLAKALYPTYFIAGDSLTHWSPKKYVKYFVKGCQFVIISKEVYIKYERNKPSQGPIKM